MAMNVREASAYRARCVAWFAVLAVLLPVSACTQQRSNSASTRPLASLSPEDAALRHKFRGIYGGELRVDATEQISKVAIYTEQGYLFNIGLGTFSPKGSAVSGYGGQVAGDRLVMPKTLRLMIYPKDAVSIFNPRPFAAWEGAPVLDVTVPVAARIPDEVLDIARRKEGMLRLKLRIHPNTLLVGWDIETRPGFDPKKRDQFGEAVYVAPVHSFAGGDFREAKIFNGQVVRKGWYIDPKTGQKIETDF